MNDWQPSATVDRLRQRAAIIKQIRDFFSSRDILEVETPALSQGTITDVYLDAMTSAHPLQGSGPASTLYLQTSPEYAMKRMLAAGFPDIYQIAKCFRQDEIGRLHNPEFTMLEWYRRDYSMQQLIDEVAELLRCIFKLSSTKQVTYQALFLQYLNIDPINVSEQSLSSICFKNKLGDYVSQVKKAHESDSSTAVDDIKDALLQILFNQCIEPHIGQDVPICVTHFPASQASLAKLNGGDGDGGDKKTALRFEFYYKGIELANGFEELTDANVQVERFENDNQIRKSLNKPVRPIDKRFITALEVGLPACSGVALGLDRLIMLALGCDSISDVMSFDISRA